MYLYSSLENGFEPYSDAYYNLENSYKESLNKLQQELKQRYPDSWSSPGGGEEYINVVDNESIRNQSDRTLKELGL